MDYQHLFRTHRKKIVIGAPILFLLLINAGIANYENTFSFVPTSSIFIAEGDPISIDLQVATSRPVNAMEGTVAYTPNVLSADAVTRTGSIIDLWSEDPIIADAEGEIHWSGGIVKQAVSEKQQLGKVFTIEMHGAHAGKATLTMKDGQLLSGDGIGTNVFSGASTLTIYVRAPGTPSPDINKDGELSLADINQLYLKTFGSFDPSYDLDQDQDLGWGDVVTLVTLMRSEPSGGK